MKRFLRLSMVPGAFLLAMAAVVGAGFASRGGVAEAAYPGADNITMTQVCASDGTIALTINWTTYNMGPQWVDMSSGVSFTPGSYNSSPQLAANQNSYVWNGVASSTPYYVRINTQAYNGWTASPIMYFTTQACSYNNTSYSNSYNNYSSMSYGYPMYNSYPVAVQIIRVPVIIHRHVEVHHMEMHHHHK